MLQVPGKSQDRKFTAAMAIPAPKSTPASTRFDPPSPKAKVSPPRQSQPRTAPFNRARKRLLQDAHGVFPRGLATHLEMPLMQDQRRISFGRLSSLPASSFQMMRAGHRIGIQRPWGSAAAARRNFNFRLSTLTVRLNQVRREAT